MLELAVPLVGSSLFLVVVGFLGHKVYRYIATLPILYRFDRIRDELWQCFLAHYYKRTGKSYEGSFTNTRKWAIWVDALHKHPEWMTTSYTKQRRFYHLHKYIREYACLFMSASPPEKFHDSLKEWGKLDAPWSDAVKEGKIKYP